MRVINEKLGPATNSSSSHSIYWCAGKVAGYGGSLGYGQFGWEEFVLTSPEEKRLYMAACLAHRLRMGNLGYQYGDARLKPQLLLLDNLMATDFAAEADGEPYVDHQSCITVPIDMDGNLHIEFWRWLTDLVTSNEHIVICGGNDNSDGQAPPPGVVDVKDAPKPYDAVLRVLYWLRDQSNEVIARKTGDNWVLFNRDTGRRLLVGSGEPVTDFYLADVKITDYCGHGCDYCYQDCTICGSHAPAARVLRTVKDLYGQGVFEVAVGGGDVLEYPSLPGLLTEIRGLGVLPSLSVKMPRSGGSGQQMLRSILDLPLGTVGAVALSMGPDDSAKCSIRSAREQGISHFHIIPALFGDAGLAKFFDDLRRVYGEHHYPTVVLLGYKTVGRGKDAAAKIPGVTSAWIGQAKAASESVNIAVDTALAREFAGQLTDVPEERFTVREGDMSLYVDCVGMTVARSSYEGKKLPLVRKARYQTQVVLGVLVQAVKEIGWDKVEEDDFDVFALRRNG